MKRLKYYRVNREVNDILENIKRRRVIENERTQNEEIIVDQIEEISGDQIEEYIVDQSDEIIIDQSEEIIIDPSEEIIIHEGEEILDDQGEEIEDEFHADIASFSENTENDGESDVYSLVVKVLKEIKCIRNEIRCLGHSKPPATIEIDVPFGCVDDFIQLEQTIKLKNEAVKSLETIFNNVPPRLSLDKYVKGCLKAILKDEAACKISWCGRKGNLAVHNFLIMDILKEMALRKFPSSKHVDVIYIIKKWFNYAKDRIRNTK